VRKVRTLPTHHFHVVFTIPAQLRSLAKANQEVVANPRGRPPGVTTMGLATCHAIIAEHDGRIDVASESAGHPDIVNIPRQR
jgi:signal transduction histidine kinase